MGAGQIHWVGQLQIWRGAAEGVRMSVLRGDRVYIYIYIEFKGMIYGYNIGILSQFRERERGNILKIHFDTKVVFYIRLYLLTETTAVHFVN